MLLNRILTSIVLIAVLVAVLFTASPTVFALIASAILLYASWEWAGLSNLSHLGGKLAYLVCMFACLLAMNFWVHPQHLFYAAACVWAFMFFCILRFPNQPKITHNMWFRLLLGIFILLPFWAAIVFLFVISGGVILLWTISVVVTADVAAYFVGKAFGKRKLAAELSPGKTWAGFVGAIILTQVVGLGGALALGADVTASYTLSILIFVLAICSVLGDLTESMMKRITGVKDSGNILPGHGGLLDRIDGYLAALPMFVLCLMLFVQGLFAV